MADLREKGRYQLHIEVQDTVTRTLIQHTVMMDFNDVRVDGIDELNEQQLLEFSSGAVAALYHNMLNNLLERIRQETPEFLVNFKNKPLDGDQDDDGTNDSTH